MSKVYLFAAVVLFWVTRSVALVRVQLATSPVYKMRVPTYRSQPLRSASIAQVQSAPTAASYN